MYVAVRTEDAGSNMYVVHVQLTNSIENRQK